MARGLFQKFHTKSTKVQRTQRKKKGDFLVFILGKYQLLLISGKNVILTAIKGDFDRLTLLFVGGVVAVIFIVLGVITLTNAGGEK